MRFNYLLSAVGLILVYIGFVMLVPIAVALIFKEYTEILSFLLPALVVVLTGFLLKFTSNKIAPVENFNDIKKSEALFIVVLVWVLFVLPIGKVFMGLLWERRMLPIIFYQLRCKECILCLQQWHWPVPRSIC